jgi:hypothetical protein
MFIIVCDIDKTLCDSGVRLDRVIKKCGSEEIWTEEHLKEFLDPEDVKKDKVIRGAQNINKIAEICGKLVILTGRNERSREDTRKWLQENLDICEDVPLIMRSDDDFSSPTECKENLFIQHILNKNPNTNFIFLDDDPKILQVFFKYGIILKAPEVWDLFDRLLNRLARY